MIEWRQFKKKNNHKTKQNTFGNSNQKLSLQDRYGTWWVGFLQSHGDMHVWAGHPKPLSEAVEPTVCDSPCPRADIHTDLTSHTPKVPISPHWAMEGAWAEQFSCRSLHRTDLEGSRGQILFFCLLKGKKWLKPKQINKSWIFCQQSCFIQEYLEPWL